MTALLRISDYRLDFETFDGAVKVLDGVELELAEGETLGLVGETGCGKSVLARSVIGLLPRTARVRSGAIAFDGEDLLACDAAAWRRLRGHRIAMIFQDPMTYLNPVLSIGRQLGDVIRVQHAAPGAAAAPALTSAQVRARAVELLELVRLPDAAALLARYPHQLSGGMRQRVLIAMALVGTPRLLIADEPTTALDVTIQAQVLALMRDLAARLRLACVMISHDLGAVAAVCRRVAVMYAGTIVEDASADELLRAPRHPYSRGLLAALPDIDGPHAALQGIAGSLPNLLAPPAGCRFHPRCALASERCRRERPVLRPLADGAPLHRVACHHA
ncbi:MAG: ABC transporter ATP-binding protein [Proteobacteria bacterium]|nr:ABC transporter ATP-binding protein [Pseudomonadota bacterium]